MTAKKGEHGAPETTEDARKLSNSDRARSFGGMRKRQHRILRVCLIVGDMLAIGSALLLAWYIRIGSGLIPYTSPSDLAAYERVAAGAMILLPVLFAFNRLYDYNILMEGLEEYIVAVRACSLGMIPIVFASFFILRGQPLSRGWLMLSWFLSIVFVTGGRFFWRRIFRFLRRSRNWLIAPTLIVGANEHGRAIARQQVKKDIGVQVVGFLDDFLPPGTPVMDGLSVLGTPNDLDHFVAEHGIEEVIIIPNAVTWETFQELMQRAGQSTDYDFHISPGFYEILATSVQVTHKASVPLLRVEKTRIGGLDLFLKIGLDFILGGLSILAAAPLLLAIAAAIWLTNGRPIFERETMLGLGGRPFRTFKFRTGLVGTARRGLGIADTRQLVDSIDSGFPLGKFLYRTGLDKLPQLVDVVRGRMSLVGPRTISTKLEDEYRSWLPSLLSVKPGWTGPWAVSGTETQEEEMRVVLYYIRNWTIWLDFQILFQTLMLVLLSNIRVRR